MGGKIIMENQLLTAVLNSLCEYIVITDSKEIIVFMSDIYKKALNCMKPEGFPVRKIIPDWKSKMIFSDGDKERWQETINNKKVIAEGEHIQVKDKFNGTLVRLQCKGILAEKNKNDNSKITGNKNNTFDTLAGKSVSFTEVIEFAKKVSKGESSILITGDSGTGKELIAEAIHNASRRADAPFVKINCGAIPPELFESEMFGYDEGAFTGARKSGQKGKFEVADGGTILLDEIGDMPLFMQVKLLRVLQEREIVRVGSNEVKKIDVRIIAATNKNLQKLIDEGTFREDLFYRLNVLNIRMPSLRERKGDISILADALRRKLCSKYNIYSEGISKEALEYLEMYNWPGNVRELENVIERAINLLNDETIITPVHLPEKIIYAEKKYSIKSNRLSEVSAMAEKETIERVLHVTMGNKKEAAGFLGISRQALYKKIKKMGIK